MIASNMAKRLLLCKLGAIGDVIMTLPAAYALHSAGYQVDWICGRAVAPLLRSYPWINVIAVDEATILRGSAFSRALAIFSLWRRLGAVRYDLCATLYYDSRYKWLTLLVRSPRKLLLSRSERETRIIPGRSYTSEYARILLAGLPSNFADAESPSQLAPFPSPENLPPTAFPPAAGVIRIALVPAGARNVMRDSALRRWPVESYVELSRLLLSRGFEVVLVGGPEDTWASAFFSGLPVKDLIGRTSLLESISLFDSAQLVVTHDTGPLHMAATTSAAVVSIFGPTDPHWFAPQRHNCVALWGGEGFACRPCYDGRDFAPCEHNGCIRQITVSMVLAEIDTLLTAVREGRQLLPRIRTPKHTPIQITSAKLG